MGKFLRPTGAICQIPWEVLEGVRSGRNSIMFSHVSTVTPPLRMWLNDSLVVGWKASGGNEEEYVMNIWTL